MSDANVDLVRTALEEFARTLRVAPAMSPDFVWDLTNYEGWPDRTVYEGLEEFVKFFEAWTEPFDRWTVEIQEIHAVDDTRVVVIMVQHGTPAGSAAEVDMRYGGIYTVEGEMITRVDVYSPAERALEAVGLGAA
jgi:ketosteroid isomerase-like protein